MKILRTDDPRDGQWIMDPGGGRYNPMMDHCVAVIRDGVIAGGVVFTGFLGAAIFVHMRGDGTNWANRTFLWCVFDYAFNLLGCRVIFGWVDADNVHAVKVDEGLGFKICKTFYNVKEDGGDVFLMEMRREACKWLEYVPSYYRSNRVAA